MDNNVVHALEARVLNRGVSTLSFNFRGVGRSEGDYDDMRGEVDDVIAALSWLARRPEIDPARIGLAGYSFGGLMAVMACARILCRNAAAEKSLADAWKPRGLALISPMAPPRGWEGSPEVRPFYDHPPRTMVVAGTADRFCTIKQAQELCVQVGPEARLIVLEGADHFYADREDEIGSLAADLFNTALFGRPA